MRLDLLHKADEYALAFYNALGIDEALQKAEENIAYYAAYGGSDSSEQLKFWNKVAAAIKRMDKQ